MLRKLWLLLLLVPFAQADIVEDVRIALAQNNFAAADSALKSYRSHTQATAEYLEALSWMARASLASRHFDSALDYARQTRAQSAALLKTRKLDVEPHLPTALGAAYEVEAQVLAEQGNRAQAIALLRSAVAKYPGASILPRLQKNLNLIALTGQPAPPLDEAKFLASKPAPLAQLKGKPVLLFFWAHWCADCKIEAPIIARLQQEFAPQGLVVLGPTQLYGYTAQQEHAAPQSELSYIEAVRQRFYANLDMAVPVSTRNFITYGASTTPTLVLINRAGKVTLFHPGALAYDELRSALQQAAGQ